MLQQNEPTRQTEMSKAVSSLHSAIDVLIDKTGVLQSRLSCVSMAKPKNPKKETVGNQLPPLIQEIRTAEAKIEKAHELINDILEDIEL